MTLARARWLLMKTASPSVRLSGWETRFLESLEAKINRFGDAAVLSDDQAAKLEEIATK
jgi:hypothetical protein